MKKSIVLALIALVAFSCKKDKVINDPVIPETNVSWWVINDDTFRTTVTEKYLNFSAFNINYQSADYDTMFSITVDTVNHNLDNDSFKLYGVMFSGSQVTANFGNHEGGLVTGPYDSGIVYSTRINGKVKLVLPPTIFRKLVPTGGGGFTHSTDTTIIQGEFYEP